MDMIFEDSDEAASTQTVTGWVSRRGHFYGADERTARYDGATHRICKVCGQPYEISSYCKPCNDRKNQDAFHAMPKKEWDGFTPLYSNKVDKYFDSLEHAEDFALGSDLGLYEMQLVICEPVYAEELTLDYFEDCIVEGSPTDALQDLIDDFNSKTREIGVLSWEPGKFALKID